MEANLNKEDLFTPERLMKFLGRGKTTINRLQNKGTITPHYLGDVGPFYLPSEIFEKLKPVVKISENDKTK